MKTKTIFLPLFGFLITVFFVFFPSVGFSQGQSSEKYEILAQNTKLRVPETVLKDYGDGKLSTRVIVNALLRHPSHSAAE